MSKVPTDTIKKTYKYFDLDSFDQKSVEKDISFTPAVDLAEAHSRIGGDESVLLKALNAFLRAEVLAKAEAEVAALGGRKSVVLSIAKPLRLVPQFAKIENRAEQTKAILEMLKSSPAMIDAIRQASLAVEGPETDEDAE